MAKRKHKNDRPTFEQLRHFNSDENDKIVDHTKRKYPNTTKGLKKK